MSKLNFDQNDDNDECNFFDFLSFNPNELCVHFPEHKLNPFEELMSECERNELVDQIIRRVIDGHWRASTQAENMFKKVFFLRFENGL